PKKASVTKRATSTRTAVRWGAGFRDSSAGSITRGSILVAQAEHPFAPERLQLFGRLPGDCLEGGGAGRILLRGRAELAVEGEELVALLEVEAEIPGRRVMDAAIVLAVELLGRRLQELRQGDAPVDAQELLELGKPPVDEAHHLAAALARLLEQR